MKPMDVRQAHNEDFEVISKLIADQNRNPKTHCIQSDTGDGYQNIQNEILRLEADSEICFVAAYQDGQLIGTFGCELDEELGRGWVRGPFVVENTEPWNAAASALFQTLLALLPPAIHRLDSFLNIKNERGNDFYFSQGFHRLRLVHVYETAIPENFLFPKSTCGLLQTHQAQDFIVLHQTVFPQTYATGQRILDKLGDDRKVFVYTQGSELLGYLYAVIDEDTGEGSVEFVGVREDARGQGIGRQLLQAALQWFSEVKNVSLATLVVNDDLTNARSLYESVGFRLKYTGVHTRKDR